MRDARRRKRMDAKRKIYGVCRYTATRQEWRVPLAENSVVSLRAVVQSDYWLGVLLVS